MNITIHHRPTGVTHTMLIAESLFQGVLETVGNEEAAIAYFRRLAKPILDSGFKGSLSAEVSKQALAHLSKHSSCLVVR